MPCHPGQLHVMLETHKPVTKGAYTAVSLSPPLRGIYLTGGQLGREGHALPLCGFSCMREAAESSCSKSRLCNLGLSNLIRYFGDACSMHALSRSPGVLLHAIDIVTIASTSCYMYIWMFTNSLNVTENEIKKHGVLRTFYLAQAVEKSCHSEWLQSGSWNCGNKGQFRSVYTISKMKYKWIEKKYGGTYGGKLISVVGNALIRLLADNCSYYWKTHF